MPSIRNREYIPAKQFSTVEDALSLGVATPAIVQVTSRDLVGFLMTAADTATLGIRVPFDLDIAYQIGLKVHYITASSTATDTFDWLITHDFVLADAALPASIITALDTVIAQDTLGAATAYLSKWTERGLINSASQPSRAQVEAGALLLLEVELDATDAAESIWLLGVEIDYTKIDWVGTSGLDAELSSIAT